MPLALPGRFLPDPWPGVPMPSGHSFPKRATVTPELKAAVAHHRSIVKMHGSKPQAAEPNSIIIALLADLVEGIPTRKAATKPK